MVGSIADKRLDVLCKSRALDVCLMGMRHLLLPGVSALNPEVLRSWKGKRRTVRQIRKIIHPSDGNSCRPGGREEIRMWQTT